MLKRLFAPAFYRRLWHGLQSPRLLFWLLPYFMLVLLAGTIAQKYVGLFTATHLFFTSFFYWVGPFPIPVGASVLALLFANLLAHFITRSQWHRKQLGTTLAHLSILILLFGGGVTLLGKEEGFMILRHNHPAHAIYDYNKRELVVYKHRGIVAVTPAESLAVGKPLQVDDGLRLTPDMLCRNCAIENAALKELPVQADDEINQSGLRFRANWNGEEHAFITTEFMGKTPALGPYRFAFRRRQTKLPFKLVLQDFSQSYYAGTDIARSYQSSLLLVEKGQADWPVQISMNSPFRYKGYTFYQSSVLNLPSGETASVLNVVDNAGWLFPYLATGMLAVGLAWHLWERRHGKK